MNAPTLTVSTSPHVHSRQNTASIMWTVSAALLPAALWGIYSYGPRAMCVLLVSVATTVLAELLCDKLTRQPSTLWDGSAVLSGLLVGMNMSPSIPFFIPIIAGLFAMLVAKWSFGGLGANWANPAIAGRVFVFFGFTNAMSSFRLPGALGRALGADAIGGATPLTFLKSRLVDGLASADVLGGNGYPFTQFAAKVADLCHVSPYVVDAFFGNIAGCIGEGSSLLLLAGGIFLLCKNVITWHIPVAYLGSFALLNWLFGGFAHGAGFAQGEVLMPLFTGGLFLGAFFMATDYVTTPCTHKGEVIFGIGCGFFTFLFRNFGSMPEAVSVSILMMNIVTPTIDRYVKNRKFGYVKPEKKGAQA